MVVQALYISRHGFRGTYSLDPTTGVYTSSILSPTSLPADPPLVAHGVHQSHELAAAYSTITPPIAYIYSSAYYRCLETMRPTAEKLGLEISVDNGLGEWYGRAPFLQPTPAPPNILNPLFPSLLCPTHTPSCYPSSHGESLSQLHSRVAFALSNIIARADSLSGATPIAICVGTHAAPLIAMGRVLTGVMPKEVEEDDFRTYTAGISRFERKTVEGLDQDHKVLEVVETGTEVPVLEWEGKGKGIMGGWECVRNCDCSHLEGGEERGWRFTGDESFSDTMGGGGAKL